MSTVREGGGWGEEVGEKGRGRGWGGGREGDRRWAVDEAARPMRSVLALINWGEPRWRTRSVWPGSSQDDPGRGARLAGMDGEWPAPPSVPSP